MSPQNWALYQRSAPTRPGYGAWAASGGGGSRTALFYSNWSTVGTSDSIIRDSTKAVPWSDRWGGTAALVVSNSPPSGCPTPNALRVEMGTGTFDWVMAKNIWTNPGIGNSLYRRKYVNNNVADSGPSGNIDGGSGYAATHPIESEGDQSGISGNFFAEHLGTRPNGTGEYYLSIDALTRQFTPGGPGGANPSTLLKSTWWRIEEKWTQTGTSAYTLNMRIYNQAGTLTYSDADGLNNMYVWGGGVMSGSNTGLTVDTAHISEYRIGINGGYSIVAGNQPQYVWWAAVAVANDDWCGAYGSFTGET